mmetsp:Transcript_9884/g.20770  ORF Transcript_9884/g.20770 Transcript_9884/m.20770 type:complete len:151 (-) Transcript_9884:1152-1604(-)
MEASDSGVLDIRAAENEAMSCTGYSPFLVFKTDDMDEKVPKLLQLGAVLDGPISYEPYAKIASMRAPCGHMIGLVESNEAIGEAFDDVAAAMAGKVRIREIETADQETSTATASPSSAAQRSQDSKKRDNDKQDPARIHTPQAKTNGPAA